MEIDRSVCLAVDRFTSPCLKARIEASPLRNAIENPSAKSHFATMTNRSAYVQRIRKAFLLRSHPDRFRSEDASVRKRQASLMQALGDRFSSPDFLSYQASGLRVDDHEAASNTNVQFNGRYTYYLQRNDGRSMKHTIRLNDTVQNVLEQMTKALAASGVAGLPEPPPPPEMPTDIAWKRNAEAANATRTGSAASEFNRMHGIIWAASRASGGGTEARRQEIDHKANDHDSCRLGQHGEVMVFGAMVEPMRRPTEHQRSQHAGQQRMADAPVEGQVVELIEKVLPQHVHVWQGACHCTPHHGSVSEAFAQHRFAYGGTQHNLRQRIHMQISTMHLRPQHEVGKGRSLAGHFFTSGPPFVHSCPKPRHMHHSSRLSTTVAAFLVGAFGFLVSPLTLRAQSTTSSRETSSPSMTEKFQGQFVKITLNDGTLKFGQLLDSDESNILVDLVGLGPTSIPKYLVLEMALEVMEVDESGEVKNLVSSQATRYFFAPSAMQLKDGEGYFQSNIALNSISYGLSDRFTAGAMIGFLGGGLTAKAGWQVGEKTKVSLGALGAADFFGELEKPLALGFINVTRGDDNKNITFNVGCTNTAFRPDYRSYYSPGATSEDNGWATYYYPESEYERYPRALMLNISGMVPLTERRWLITENYFVTQNAFAKVVESPYYGSVRDDNYLNYIYTGNDVVWPNSNDDFGILSLGVRSYSRRSGWLWDYGLAAVIVDGYGVPVPWFSFTLEF